METLAPPAEALAPPATEEPTVPSKSESSDSPVAVMPVATSNFRYSP